KGKVEAAVGHAQKTPLKGLRFETLEAAQAYLLTYTLPATLEAIGDGRLAWPRTLPLRWSDHDLTVVHAVPDDAWGIVPATASDEDMERVYAVLGSTRVLYGHIHTPFVRRRATFTLVNTGAVSQSFDGDPRAAYALSMTIESRSGASNTTSKK